MAKTFKHRLFTRFKSKLPIGPLFDLLGSELTPKKWVFIVGCYNSGTTLLSEILSLHNDLTVLPDEGVMLCDTLPRPEDFGWRRMWYMCEEKMKPEIGASKIRSIKRQWSHFVSRNPEIVVEKSISNTARIDFLNRNFKPAYFIHIVRNGYAVAEGIRRKALVMPESGIKGESYTLDMTASQWKRSIEVVDEEKNELDTFIEITYEDLTENTSEAVGKICHFLNVKPMSKEKLDIDFNIHNQLSGIRNLNDRSLSCLSGEELETIRSVAFEELKKFGYHKEKS